MKVMVLNKRVLMVQGTTSDAGKSVITAGICRVLARLNRSVAPFKPQNMALNSAVTEDGGEIGRAQMVQAQACGIPSSLHMNPILLKPSSDTEAQVIVQGKAVQAKNAQEFHAYKQRAMQFVEDSLHQLLKKYEQIIVEGAGSPAEINLREGDIANMGFAEKVDCPVILVADIDRGGVFAQIVGTLELLAQSERGRIIGFVINRFRGDVALLQPGLDWLEEKTGKPVLGVIPYLSDFYLDAEDALSQTQRLSSQIKTQLKVRVPVLPRISNHTDFDALRLYPSVDFQYVSINDNPRDADLIILPGSKNTRSDLHALKQAGWQTHLKRHLRYGGKVMGICGGYQMLGEAIDDPLSVEGPSGSSQGFGFLPLQTTLLAQKALKKVEGHFQLGVQSDSSPSINFYGYEVHCGTSKIIDVKRARNRNKKPSEKIVQFNDGRSDGILSDDGQVFGTYVHGIFDAPEACDHLLQWAGLENTDEKSISIEQEREHQLNRLADTLEKSLDFDKLFSCLQSG